MSLTDKLDAAHAESTQASDVSTARAAIQPIREDVVRVNTEIQVIADGGSFETVDVEIKQAIQAAWQVVKDAEAAFEDPTIAELLDWRPS